MAALYARAIEVCEIVVSLRALWGNAKVFIYPVHGTRYLYSPLALEKYVVSEF